MFLGDDYSARQCSLEAAAERIPLDKRHRNDVVFVPDMIRVRDIDAGIGVASQTLPVALANSLAEQRQIAAKVEYAGRA